MESIIQVLVKVAIVENGSQLPGWIIHPLPFPCPYQNPGRLAAMALGRGRIPARPFHQPPHPPRTGAPHAWRQFPQRRGDHP
jgi:hypothetical protein